MSASPTFPLDADGVGTLATPEPSSRTDTVEAAAAQRTPRVSIGEVALLAGATIIGVVALVSLAAAHLHHHTLIGVSAVSAVLLLALLGVVLRLDRPRIGIDLPGLAPILAGVGLAAVLTFPGFEYGTGDRDPGAYVEHAVAISRTHSIDFPDDLVGARLTGGLGIGAGWPGMWNEPGHPGKIFPQFYHLWPALLATAKDAGGFNGLFNTGPLLDVLAVGLAVAIARRLAGLPAAWATAMLLGTNMLEVWQAKYPTAEIFGQMLFVGALLGVVLAIQTRWRAAAAAGGFLLSLSYLERADGIILVVLAWTALCVLLAVRRFDQRAGWFAGGLLVVLPYGFYQAYHLAKNYTLVNSVPSLSKLLAGMIGLALVAAVLAWQRRLAAGVLAWGSRPSVRHGLGTAFVMLCAVLMLVGGLRPKLFGRDYQIVGGVPQRSFDEISLIRLSWFFSLPGLALLLAGFAFIAWRRWTLDRWLVALPTAGLLALYCYHVRNSPYLMWSTRRFVTTVVPGMVLMIGCGAALLFVVLRRYLTTAGGAVVVAAALAGLMVFNLSESWPLRHLNENGGSVEVELQMAALSGGQRGVFLWQHSSYCCAAPYLLFGGPLFTIADQSSAVLPVGSAAERNAISHYLRYASTNHRPLFYVADRNTVPPPVAGVRTTKVTEFAGTLPHWEETFISRPKKRDDYEYDMTVYRLTST